jgi:hypothetical protein
MMSKRPWRLLAALGRFSFCGVLLPGQLKHPLQRDDRNA